MLSAIRNVPTPAENDTELTWRELTQAEIEAVAGAGCGPVIKPQPTIPDPLPNPWPGG